MKHTSHTPKPTLLQEMKAMAEVLNSATDGLNSRLEMIQDRLRLLNLGVTAGESMTVDGNRCRLVYRRCGDVWGLYVEEGNQVMPLTSAPRSLRLAAISALEPLIGTLLSNARQTLQDVRQANLSLDQVLLTLETATHAR